MADIANLFTMSEAFKTEILDPVMEMKEEILRLEAKHREYSNELEILRASNYMLEDRVMQLRSVIEDSGGEVPS